MPSPNIFYAYTESYPPSMHESQLWKYNNCNSFPKVGTSVYTSAKNRKTSCLIPSPNYGLQLVPVQFDYPPALPTTLTGYSKGVLPSGAGYSAAGSLTPSSMYGTTLLGVWVINPPATQQIHIAIAGVLPTSITVTGGDLTQSYTLKQADANCASLVCGNPGIWYWLNNGFYFTPGVTYTVFINK
jgi:hypothetical protein